MANPTVQIDLLEGLNGDYDIINGPVFYATGKVSGLASDGMGNFDAGGATSGQLYQRSLNAIMAVRAIASACPGVTIPHYLKAYSFPKFESVDVARMKLTYKGFPAIQIEFNSSLASVEDYVDNQGNPITVVYTYPSDYIGNPLFHGNTFTQGKAVSRSTSEVTFTVRYTTAGLTGITADSLLVGKVNQNSYPVGVISGAPRTWLVTGFRALTEDGGITYNAALSMQWRETTWDNPVFFINPDTGNPPPDLIVGTGTKTPQMAKGANLPILI